MVHVPILRGGRPYRSLERLTLHHVATGAPVAEVSQANPGLISHDLARAASRRSSLERVSASELLSACSAAATLFSSAELPLDAEQGTTQSADAYLEQLSSTTGLPLTLGRRNAAKIAEVLSGMERVLAGLTRGLDPAVLDRGWVEQDGRVVSFRAQADVLGAVLPGNSPGVHTLWLPAIPLKIPLALKPGGREPWTPLRVAQALISAGCPAAAFGLYPSSHAGAETLLLRAPRSLLFGDASTVGPWADDPRVQIHGPGYSKVLIGDDELAGWERHLDLLAESVALDGGRSCLNASGIWLSARGRSIAEALALRLLTHVARPLDDPRATLAAFPDPEQARRVSAHIDRMLLVPGAEDVSAAVGRGDRVQQAGGCTFVLPTIVHCQDPEHPLARAEFLFPFASVVELPQSRMAEAIGPTLVATALTSDPALRHQLLASGAIDRLNLGAFPTPRVSRDQPHEGNLFEHLYRQRALQAAATG